jgi:hypothetical protein
VDALYLLIPIALVCVLADYYLCLTFSKWYFTTGPVLFRSIRFVAGAREVPSVEALQNAVSSRLFGRIIFRDFGAYTYAFRRSLLGRPSLVNGILEFNPQRRVVVVQARLSLVSMGFLAVWFGAAAFMGGLEPIAIVTAIFAVVLGSEYLDVQRALSVAAKAWSTA